MIAQSSQGIAYSSKMKALSSIELILFYVFILDPGEMAFNFTGQAGSTGLYRIVFILNTSRMEVIKSNPLSAEKL